MPRDDQEQSASPDEPRREEALGVGDSVPVEPAQEDIQTSFERMMRVLKKTVASREEIARWVGAWLPLIVALKSLATTATKLAWRARQLVERERDEPVFDQEVLDEIEADFAELVGAFPEASALFFGVENIDRLVRETLQDEDARAVVARFVDVVEAKMNGLVTRLVTWGLEDGAPGLSVEKLEGFVRSLERLLDEVLERWVLPRVYEKFDE